MLPANLTSSVLFHLFVLCCVSVSLNCQCFACCFFSLIRSFFKYQVLNLVKASCLGGICFLLYCMTSIEWNLLEVYVKTVRLGHITTIWLWTPINLCRYRYMLCSVMTNSVPIGFLKTKLAGFDIYLSTSLLAEMIALKTCYVKRSKIVVSI